MRERAIRRSIELAQKVRERASSLPFLSQPPIGFARFGAMHRMRPVSNDWGFDRGLPIDRWYVRDFLARFAPESGYAAGDIQGRVVEVGEDTYAREYGRFGGPHAVSSIDILNFSTANPKATIIADLTSGHGVPHGVADCLICTQTLHVLYDVTTAVRSIHSLLAEGGVALVTVPGITRSCIPDRDRWGDYWRFTARSADRMFGDVFGAENVRLEVYGNLLTAMGFLQGMAAEEFAEWELRMRDPDFEVLIGIRAQRASGD